MVAFTERRSDSHVTGTFCGSNMSTVMTSPSAGLVTVRTGGDGRWDGGADGRWDLDGDQEGAIEGAVEDEEPPGMKRKSSAEL